MLAYQWLYVSAVLGRSLDVVDLIQYAKLAL